MKANESRTLDACEWVVGAWNAKGKIKKVHGLYHHHEHDKLALKPWKDTTKSWHRT